MIIADANTCLEVSGKGELLEPQDGVHAIGSGARFAVAAARALMQTALPPLEIAQRAMAISAARCVYTNRCVLGYASAWHCGMREVLTVGLYSGVSSAGADSAAAAGDHTASNGNRRCTVCLHKQVRAERCIWVMCWYRQ